MCVQGNGPGARAGEVLGGGEGGKEGKGLGLPLVTYKTESFRIRGKIVAFRFQLIWHGTPSVPYLDV